MPLPRLQRSDTKLINSQWSNFDVRSDYASMYQGDDMDITRWTSPTISDHFYEIVDRDNLPRHDSRKLSTSYSFGSAHPQGWQAAFCDGSVHLIGYSVDADLHRRLGNRQDGQVVDTQGL